MLDQVLKTAGKQPLKAKPGNYDKTWEMFIILTNFRLKGVLKTSWQGNLKTPWRRLEDIWPRRIYWSISRRPEDIFWRRRQKDVFKTSSSRRMFAAECNLRRNIYSVFSVETMRRVSIIFFELGVVKNFM